MSVLAPDDPRHGRHAGYVQHIRFPELNGPPCDACRRANADYQRSRELDKRMGRPRTMPAIGARRRVQALQRLGWSLRMIATEAGWNTPEALQYVLRNHSITRRSYLRIVTAYERLCMTVPPYNSATVRARLHAERCGFPPPLAWDDIDDPDEEPKGVADKWRQRRPDEVDQAVVHRILQGERLRATRAERDECVRRWVAMGGSERSLCQRMGWKDSRYGKRAMDDERMGA